MLSFYGAISQDVVRRTPDLCDSHLRLQLLVSSKVSPVSSDSLFSLKPRSVVSSAVLFAAVVSFLKSAVCCALIHGLCARLFHQSSMGLFRVNASQKGKHSHSTLGFSGKRHFFLLNLLHADESERVFLKINLEVPPFHRD